MEFLEDNQIRAWAEQQGLPGGDGSESWLTDLSSVYRSSYADGRRSGHETASAEDLVTRLGSWDECLVWIKSWGVWPSGEDWPRFYAWRGALGERRSLDTAPGHRFDRDDTSLLTQLLALVMENAWDADIFCSGGGRLGRTCAKISHDEWYELFREGPSADK